MSIAQRLAAMAVAATMLKMCVSFPSMSTTCSACAPAPVCPSAVSGTAGSSACSGSHAGWAARLGRLRCCHGPLHQWRRAPGRVLSRTATVAAATGGLQLGTHTLARWQCSTLKKCLGVHHCKLGRPSSPSLRSRRLPSLLLPPRLHFLGVQEFSQRQHRRAAHPLLLLLQPPSELSVRTGLRPERRWYQ